MPGPSRIAVEAGSRLESLMGERPIDFIECVNGVLHLRADHLLLGAEGPIRRFRLMLDMVYIQYYWDIADICTISVEIDDVTERAWFSRLQAEVPSYFDEDHDIMWPSD